jgi:hypothetical protein
MMCTNKQNIQRSGSITTHLQSTPFSTSRLLFIDVFVLQRHGCLYFCRWLVLLDSGQCYVSRTRDESSSEEEVARSLHCNTRQKLSRDTTLGWKRGVSKPPMSHVNLQPMYDSKKVSYGNPAAKIVVPTSRLSITKQSWDASNNLYGQNLCVKCLIINGDKSKPWD